MRLYGSSLGMRLYGNSLGMRLYGSSLGMRLYGNSLGMRLMHTHTHPFIPNKTLVKHGANVDAADSQGNTPLHLLCTEKRKMDTLSDCIAMLVRLKHLIVQYSHLKSGMSSPLSQTFPRSSF